MKLCITQTFLTCLILHLLACGADSGEGNNSKRTVKKQSSSQENDPYLSSQRWLRRASLDITGQLPLTEDLKKVALEPDQTYSIIDGYSGQARSNTYFAKLHNYIWNFKDNQFPDLQRYINAGDATLALDLDNATRSSIQDDVFNLIKFNMDEQKPYSELFKTNFSLGEDRLFTFWNYTNQLPVGLGTPLSYAIYQDNRPASGLLSNQSFLAHFDSRQTDVPYARTLNIFEKLSCSDFYSESAHSFVDLDEETLSQSLRGYATADTVCAGCHSNFDQSAQLFVGLATGITFGDFGQYTNTTSAVTTRYLGQNVQTLSDLTELMSINPAVSRCHIKKTIETIQQREFTNDFDTATLNEIEAVFQANGRNLATFSAVLAKSNNYRLKPFDRKSSRKQSRVFSGIKFLNILQWNGIISQLGFDPDDFSIQDTLDVSWKEISDNKSFHPQSSYWHSVKTLAEQLSKAICERELNLNTSLSERKLFSTLPQNFFNDQEVATIQKQISDLVLQLTALDSENDKEAEDFAEDLYDLWLAGLGSVSSSGESQNRLAWRMVLKAIFLSSHFLNY